MAEARTKEAAASTHAGLLLGLLIALTPPSVRAANQPSMLRIEGDPTLVVDPVCGLNDTLHVDLKLWSTQAIQVALGTGAVVSKTAGVPFTASARIGFLSDDGGQGPATTRLQVGAASAFRVTVSGNLQEGEWEIPLLNQGVEFGKARVLNLRPAPALTLDTSTVDNPQISFERGRHVLVAIKNEDNLAHRLAWTYSVDGEAICGSTIQHASADCDSLPDPACDLELPANGFAQFRLSPPAAWFRTEQGPSFQILHPIRSSVNSLRWAVPRLKGLLKDDVADGRLTVRVCSPKCRAQRGTASKVFKVKTQLAAFSKDGQSFGGFALLFMTLLAGGLASLLMNFTLPIQARRLRVKDRLAETDRKIDSLSTDLDSRIRVPLGVERRRLAVRLGRLTWFTAFGQGMSDVEQGLDRLAKRLDMLEQLQRTLAGYWKARAINIPPTVIEQIEITKKQVVDILQKSEPADADFQAALGLIQQIDKSVVMSAQADVEFARRLVEDLARRKGELAANTGPLTYLWVPDFQLLSEALKSDLIRAPDDVKGILASDYIPLDRLLFRLRLLEAYQRVLKGPQVPPPAWDFWSTELLAELRDSSWESLKRAQRMIRQMEEGLFPEDVIAEVQNGRAEVIVDRVLVSQFESTDLRLRFRRRDVQSAAAREEFTYVWDFGHDFLRERGWTVSHFFPEATEPSPQPLRDAWRTLRRWSREPAGLPTPGASPLPPTGSNPSHPAPGTNTPPGGEGSLAPRAPYDLTVTLIREWNGEEVPDKIRCKIHVLPPPPVRSRVFQAELFRLLLALGLAVLGLVAGAKDQILKLDVLPALVAVFLIGFGADQIKNLVTQRPQP